MREKDILTWLNFYSSPKSTTLQHNIDYYYWARPPNVAIQKVICWWVTPSYKVGDKLLMVQWVRVLRSFPLHNLTGWLMGLMINGNDSAMNEFTILAHARICTRSWENTKKTSPKHFRNALKGRMVDEPSDSIPMYCTQHCDLIILGFIVLFDFVVISLDLCLDKIAYSSV